MHNFSVDEYFTISTLHPKLTPENTIHRALNGPRTFSYLFYPGALVGMNSHLGGNVYVDGWEYPGQNYFVKNYKVVGSGLAKNMEDPNLRYFHYYLKLQSIVLMFLSFIPLLFYLWRNDYLVALFMMSTLIGINFLFVEERSKFYIEPLLLTMFNVLIWIYLYLNGKKQIGLFLTIFISFIFALTISLKFSALFLILLIGILIVSKTKSLESRLKTITLMILFSSAFFYIINWNIFSSKEVFNIALHDYLSNFWHYATGKSVVSENYIVENIKRMSGVLFSSLGGLLFLVPVIILYGLKQQSNKERIIWGGLLVTILISVALIAKQKVYMGRNILPFLPVIIMITGIMLDITIKRIWQSEKLQGHKSAKRYVYILLAILVFLPISVKSGHELRTVFPSARQNIENSLSGIINKENRRLVEIGYATGLKDISFKSIVNYESAPETNSVNFSKFVQDYSSKLRSDDIVVISEIGNNKQLTNYLLPKLFDSNIQYAEHFVFYNEVSKNQAFTDIITEYDDPRNQELFDDAVAIRPDLILKGIKLARHKDVYRIFFKFNFLSQKNDEIDKCRFFFHGMPYERDIQNLPEERIRHGYDGWDFSVAPENWVRYGTELFVVHDFNPTLKEYSKFEFGIFRGCAKSENFSVSDIKL